MAANQRGFWETVLRIGHIMLGVAALSVSTWFLIAVSPFNPYGFGIFLIVGVVLLLIGLFGKKRSVFETFFISGL